MSDPVAEDPILEAALLAFTRGRWPTGDDEADLEMLRGMEAALKVAGVISKSKFDLKPGRYLVTIDEDGSWRNSELLTKADALINLDRYDEAWRSFKDMCVRVPAPFGRAA